MKTDQHGAFPDPTSTAGSAIGAGRADLARGSSMGKLVAAFPAFSAMMPNTDYYEIASAQVGTHLAIWVSRPDGYDGESPVSAVYMPDGNTAALSLCARSTGLRYDSIHPIAPIVTVAVGYTGAEARDAGRVRNRDLVPPGEPVDPGLEKEIDRRQALGAFTSREAAMYKASLRETHADRFLRFLTDELHPQIAARYAIDESTTGLFGYSYGGLFSTWAALQRPRLFSRIGAGSPGILVRDSEVFAELERQQAANADFTGQSLHMTVNELEQTAPTLYQGLGENFAHFNTMIGRRPLRGLDFSSRVIRDESHQTGIAASWHSFLRNCYSA